jgi:hypothetical protein
VERTNLPVERIDSGWAVIINPSRIITIKLHSSSSSGFSVDYIPYPCSNQLPCIFLNNNQYSTISPNVLTINADAIPANTFTTFQIGVRSGNRYLDRAFMYIVALPSIPAPNVSITASLDAPFVSIFVQSLPWSLPPANTGNASTLLSMLVPTASISMRYALFLQPSTGDIGLTLLATRDSPDFNVRLLPPGSKVSLVLRRDIM